MPANRLPAKRLRPPQPPLPPTSPLQTRYLRLREPVNSLTHWLGALLALPVLGALLWYAGVRELVWWPFVVFALSMLFLYASSASYHSFFPTERGLRWLRKLDHGAIFLLIAGTYTPVLYFGLDGRWRTGALLLIWGTALLGTLLKVATMRLPRWISTALYLGMGWIAVGLLPRLAGPLGSETLLWLGLGGLLYTVGAIIYATKRWNPRPGVFGFHEIWHLFVLGGTAAHVAMMFTL